MKATDLQSIALETGPFQDNCDEKSPNSDGNFLVVLFKVSRHHARGKKAGQRWDKRAAIRL
jgi:hypothetical protein